MTLVTPNHNFLYSFKYDYHHSSLCKLESRQIFGEEEKDNLLISKVKIDPSFSAFIKNRLQIISTSESFSELLESIRNQKIRINGFNAEYLILNGDSREKPERREKLKDVGYCIDGRPDYVTPTINYGICHYENTWYFGILIKQNSDWRKHKKKPYSFSNSIGMIIAKTLVSIASKGDKDNHLLDACCGVGTIMLESSFDGIKIEGCDISPKRCHQTRDNLAHYQYSANVHCSDIQDLDQKYDAVIIDLPYNLYSYSNDDIALKIIESTAKLAKRLVIVSTSDVKQFIKESGFKIADCCAVEKRGKSGFTRNIWVCEKVI